MTTSHHRPPLAEEDDSWRQEAACAGDNDPAFWFPRGIAGRGTNTTEEMEKEVAKECSRRECPVMAECLAYAFSTNQVEGVWGGQAFSDAKWRRQAKRKWSQAS